MKDPWEPGATRADAFRFTTKWARESEREGDIKDAEDARYSRWHHAPHGPEDKPMSTKWGVRQ